VNTTNSNGYVPEIPAESGNSGGGLPDSVDPCPCSEEAVDGGTLKSVWGASGETR
jgi:hypothetical protein